MTSWDILIPTVTSRHEMFHELLEHLGGQMVPGVGVRAYRDNLERPVGDKLQALVKSSSAEYISTIGDDDWVSDDYVASLLAAIEQHPDYVGFKSHYFHDGVFQGETVESLEVTVPSTLCPVRRDLATLVAYAGGAGEDRRWAAQMVALGVFKSEVFVDRVVYHYRHRSTNSVQNGTIQRYSGPMRAFDAPWLTWFEEQPHG